LKADDNGDKRMKRRILNIFLCLLMVTTIFVVALPSIPKPIAIKPDEEIRGMEEEFSEIVRSAHGTRAYSVEGTIMDGKLPTSNIPNWGSGYLLAIGVKFEVNYDCTVDKLGIYMNDSYIVGYNLRLWDVETQTQIASTNGVFKFNNLWGWINIPPTNLYAGDTYIVSAFIRSTLISCIDNPGPNPDGVIDPTGFVYDDGNGFPSILFPGSILPMVDIHYYIEPNTPVGSYITVELGSGVTVIFSEVTEAGLTTARVTDQGPQPSDGFKMIPTTPIRYYQIRTTAVYTGFVKVSIKYQETWFLPGENEADLRIWHYIEPDWLDVTDPGFPDTASNIVLGTVNSLSYFVLAIPTDNPIDLKQDAITELEDAKTGNKKIDKKIDTIIGQIENSLDDGLWIDDIHLDLKQGHMAYDRDKTAVKKIQELLIHKDTPDSVEEACKETIDKIVKAEELIAKTALEEAEAYLGTDKKVNHHILIAEQEFANAEEKLARGQPDKAIDHYRKAWEHAQLAIFLANR
jgi:hypothetical protein